MKVYVITQGIYSDYHICAVTLDAQEAERLRKVYDESGDRARVEEYETDGPDAKKGMDGRVPYHVHFGKGYVHYSMSYRDPDDFTPGVFLGPGFETVDLFAPDSEAAVKIAAEKRAMALAEKEGIV